MCHKATLRGLVRCLTLALAGTLAASAQTDWRPIGSAAIESRLAGPISGPVVNVWYAPDGSALYASTGSKTFETEDFESWKPAADAPPAPQTVDREPSRKPEAGARYIAVSGNSQDVWGLGRLQLYRSADGANWQTLTSYRAGSVIGGEMRGVAVSPSDPNQLAVANDYGVWRSLDGGLTWASLNLRLPNLAVARIAATPSGGHPARILTANDTSLELTPGSTLWHAYPAAPLPLEQYYSGKLGLDITAVAQAGNGRVYVGLKDGRIWSSVDGGNTFPATQAAPAAAGHPVERLYADPTNQLVALAALGGKTPRILHTWNGGSSWEPLGAEGLPDVQVNAVTADPASGAVYVATDSGVYWTRFDFETGVVTTDLHWTNLSEGLPQAKAVDVALDPAAVQLYVALDGYGLFGAPAPHRTVGLRLVNAADYTTRAASPGSLVSILGERISSVTGGALRYPLWSNSQIQVPFEAVGPTVSLALETASGTRTRDLQVLPVSPAIFVGTDGTPMILDADSGMPLEGNVAHPGQRLQVLATGLGKVRPDWLTGMPAPMENPPAVVAKVQAYLDRSEVPVGRSTLAPGYVGYYLVEVQLPPVANYGGMELYVTADGQESNHVQIVIAQ